MVIKTWAKEKIRFFSRKTWRHHLEGWRHYPNLWFKKIKIRPTTSTEYFCSTSPS